MSTALPPLGAPTSSLVDFVRLTLDSGGSCNECCACCSRGKKLLCCERDGCPAAFHLSCVGLERIPHARTVWWCPTCVYCYGPPPATKVIKTDSDEPSSESNDNEISNADIPIPPHNLFTAVGYLGRLRHHPPMPTLMSDSQNPQEVALTLARKRTQWFAVEPGGSGALLAVRFECVPSLVLLRSVAHPDESLFYSDALVGPSLHASLQSPLPAFYCRSSTSSTLWFEDRITAVDCKVDSSNSAESTASDAVAISPIDAQTEARMEPEVRSTYVAFALDDEGCSDTCILCAREGKLLLCENEGCPAALHLACAGLTVVPTGEWHCPLCASSEYGYARAEARALIAADYDTSTEDIDENSAEVVQRESELSLFASCDAYTTDALAWLTIDLNLKTVTRTLRRERSKQRRLAFLVRTPLGTLSALSSIEQVPSHARAALFRVRPPPGSEALYLSALGLEVPVDAIEASNRIDPELLLTTYQLTCRRAAQGEDVAWSGGVIKALEHSRCALCMRVDHDDVKICGRPHCQMRLHAHCVEDLKREFAKANPISLASASATFAYALTAESGAEKHESAPNSEAPWSCPCCAGDATHAFLKQLRDRSDYMSNLRTILQTKRFEELSQLSNMFDEAIEEKPTQALVTAESSAETVYDFQTILPDSFEINQNMYALVANSRLLVAAAHDNEVDEPEVRSNSRYPRRSTRARSQSAVSTEVEPSRPLTRAARLQAAQQFEMLIDDTSPEREQSVPPLDDAESVLCEDSFATFVAQACALPEMKQKLLSVSQSRSSAGGNRKIVSVEQATSADRTVPLSVQARLERVLDPFDDIVRDAYVPAEVETERLRPNICAFCKKGGDDELSGGSYYDAENDFIGPFIEKFDRASDTESTEIVHWAHRQCAFWSPNVFVKNKKFHNVLSEIRRSAHLLCRSCRKSGASVGCIVKHCRHSYHICCAIKDMCFVNERTFAILCPEHYMEHLTFEAFKTTAARPYTGCVDLWDRLQDIRTQRVKTVAQQLSRRQQQRRLRALAKSQAISQTRAASLLKSAAAALNGTDNKMAEELQLSTSWPQSLGAPAHLLPASFLFSYSFPTNSNDPDVVRQEAMALNIKVEKEEMKAGALVAGGSSGSAPSGSVAPLESLLNQDALTDLGTDWKSVGGLDQHIRALREAVQFPLLYPDFYTTLGIRAPGGIVLHGPPGTGKTLLAKALAASCSKLIAGRPVAFFSRKGADVLSRFYGESEKALIELFAVATQNAPSVIFFDEIDALCPIRDAKQNQVHASLVATLLSLMDGVITNKARVFVLAATNRLDSLDPALRRPGRFDRELYVPLPDLKARVQILKVHTRGWLPEPPADEDLQLIATRCEGFNGADLAALSSATVLSAARRACPELLDDSKEVVEVERYSLRRRRAAIDSDDEQTVGKRQKSNDNVEEAEFGLEDEARARRHRAMCMSKLNDMLVERRDWVTALQRVPGSQSRLASNEGGLIPALQTPAPSGGADADVTRFNQAVQRALAVLRNAGVALKDEHALAEAEVGGSQLGVVGLLLHGRSADSALPMEDRIVYVNRVAAAVVGAFDTPTVVSLDMNGLLSSNVSPENALIEAFRRIQVPDIANSTVGKSARASILFLPHLTSWWSQASATMRACFDSMLGELIAIRTSRAFQDEHSAPLIVLSSVSLPWTLSEVHSLDLPVHLFSFFRQHAVGC